MVKIDAQLIGIFFIILNVFILLVLVPLPILVGIYVYKDAHIRRMDVAFWTLLSVLLPCLIGFIIFLFARNKYPSDYCPKCDSVIKADWQTCPVCAAPLPQQENSQLFTQKQLKKHGLLAGAIFLSLLTMFTLAILFLSDTYIYSIM